MDDAPASHAKGVGQMSNGTRKILTSLGVVMTVLMMTNMLNNSRAAGKTLIYKDGTTELEGYLAIPEHPKASMPGVLVIHDWLGNSEYSRMRADMLADLGYVALAVDVYGKGVRPANNDEAGKEAGKYYADRGLYQRRLTVALEELKKVSGVDPKRLGAMGYCFGGQGALELARSGADLAGIVSFHGSLVPPDSTHVKPIKAKVLVCHGAADPFVSKENIAHFADEMNAGKVTWEFVEYSGAVHSFTKKAAGDDPSKGQAYNERADKRSWDSMKSFWKECFGE